MKERRRIAAQVVARGRPRRPHPCAFGVCAEPDATGLVHCVYPPIDDFRVEGPKERAILSVGRIFRGLYNDKRYDVMLDGFRAVRDGRAGG
jgi:hypothetical protein